MKRHRYHSVGLTLILAGLSLLAQADVRVNQLGFLPTAEKLAIVTGTQVQDFQVIDVRDGHSVFRGRLSPARLWPLSDEQVMQANFSALTAPGNYRLQVGAESVPLVIDEQAYAGVSAGALKAFYFNRASTPLLPAQAGIYQRAAGHPDDHVLIHESAASSKRPAGSVISSPKGWYDAGDYNKYIVNSGISTYSLLAAFERFPQFFMQEHINIPESGNGAPDILNESLWNLTWMLSMQDPQDGGVYHKLTSKAFSGFVMPADDKSERYVVQKTTAAALDFAAVMAVASRVYGAYEKQWPGLSARMLVAAQQAYAWAKTNPAIYYQQPKDISTGEYSDNKVADEFFWAAAELYITTRDEHYYRDLNPSAVDITVPSWSDVQSLAWLSLAAHSASLTPVADQALIRTRLQSLADKLVNRKRDSTYAISLDYHDFVWGSNAVALNQAMMLLSAYELMPERREYLNSAQALLDYVLGRNPVGYSYVTGFGTHTPMHIHHRPSAADGIDNPVPGFLAGGANPGQQDKKTCSVPYPSNLPAKSYLDNTCSYASNEIAINWNAPLVFVTAGLSVLSH